MRKQLENRLQNLMAVLVSLFLIVYGLHELKDFLVPIFFAGLLSFLLLPVVVWLNKKRVPDMLAIVLAILTAFLLLTILVVLAVAQIRSFDEIIPLLVQKGTSWLKSLQIFLRDRLPMGETELINEGRKYLTGLLENISSVLGNTLSGTTAFIANFALIPLYVFLMLLYRNFFMEFIFRAFPKVQRDKLKGIVERVKSVTQNYLAGLLLVILIIGTLNTISLLLLGIDNALFFGFLAAFLVLIPYIGIAIGALLPILMALITKDSYWYAVGVAGSFGAIQFLEGNFITPYIVGSKVSINSFIAIIALILFGTLWGISGMVLAIPLTAILKVIFDSVESLKPYGYLFGEVEEES